MQFTLKFKEEKKHSVIFENTEEDTLIKSVYVMRKGLAKLSAEYASDGTIPKEIKVTVECT